MEMIIYRIMLNFIQFKDIDNHINLGIVFFWNIYWYLLK